MSTRVLSHRASAQSLLQSNPIEGNTHLLESAQANAQLVTQRQLECACAAQILSFGTEYKLKDIGLNSEQALDPVACSWMGTGLSA